MTTSAVSDDRLASDQPRRRPPNAFLANLSRKTIPSLNGLRGAAALVVVLYHYLQQTAWDGIFPGPYAVTLFFELSGLLITWLLLTEQERAGQVNVRQFYWRRALRLFPLFYVVWGLCRSTGPFPGNVAMFLYLGDYYTAVTHRYSLLTAAWSLGIEEKFYLLWPFLLLHLRRRTVVGLCIGILVIEPVYRALLSTLGHAHYTQFAFDTRLDAIIIGCLLAIVAKNAWTPPGWLQHPATPACALVLAVALQNQPDLVTYLLAVLLLSVICRPPKLLNNPVIEYLGAVSYALYLSHVYVREVLWRALFPQAHLSLPAALLTQLTLALAFATLLHFAVERPFLRLKGRHSRTPQSP